MASILGIDTTRNLSLYTIPICWVISLMPHVYASRTYEAATKKEFDIKEPRSFTRKLEADQSIDSKTKGRILRAEGAQQNGFENIGLFAAAVVAANVAKVDSSWLNGLSIGYLVSRFIYNHVYMFNETKTLAQLRTVTFLSGIGMIFTLYIQAGNKMRNAVI